MSFLNRQRIKDVVAQPFVYDKEGRMRVFDAIRGLSMFLVVFGHVLGCFDLGGYDSFLGSVILTFRMPLFFFISGFFAYRAVGDWTFGLCRRVLAQKVRAQVLCTLLFLHCMIMHLEVIILSDGLITALEAIGLQLFYSKCL